MTKRNIISIILCVATLVRVIIWRSRLVRPRAHDWKSCRCQKHLEGSNPSFSAKKTHSENCVSFIMQWILYALLIVLYYSYLAIFLLVSLRQKFLSFYFLHFLCIFSDDATFGKDVSRPNLSFFLISFKKIERKQRRLARILLHEKRRKRGKYAEK